MRSSICLRVTVGRPRDPPRRQHSQPRPLAVAAPSRLSPRTRSTRRRTRWWTRMSALSGALCFYSSESSDAIWHEPLPARGRGRGRGRGRSAAPGRGRPSRRWRRASGGSSSQSGARTRLETSWIDLTLSRRLLAEPRTARGLLLRHGASRHPHLPAHTLPSPPRPRGASTATPSGLAMEVGSAH
jgi:hypothetical protein